MSRADPSGRHHRIFQWAQEHGEVGGVLTSHHQLTDQLRNEGHEVSYVDTGAPRRAVAAAQRLWSGRALHLFHITRLWRAIVLAPLFAVLPGRTVLVLHSGSVSRQLASMGRPRALLLRSSLHAYDEIWAVNDQIRSGLPTGLAGRVRVVTPFSGAAAQGTAADRDTSDGVGSGPRRDPALVSVATNAGLAHYNAELAVEAVGLARAQQPELRLRILAYGHDGPDLGRLRSRVAALPWVELTFDAGPAEVRQVLQQSAVFLRPTSWDGDSVILREALAAGARVLASDAAPRPAGVELAPLDPTAFSAALVHGGTVSDGAGLADTDLLEAARAALQAMASPSRTEGNAL